MVNRKNVGKLIEVTDDVEKRKWKLSSKFGEPSK